MRILLISIFVILLGIFPDSSISQEELDQYLIEGAENNPGLKARFNSYMAALEQTNIVGRLPDPQLAFAYFIKPVETRLGPQQFKFSVSQMFPWFGTLDAQKNVAVEMAKMKYEMFEQSKSQLFYDIRMTYYNLYFFSKAINTTEENISILKSLQRLALVKYEAGKTSIVDELRIEMELNDLENQLMDLKDNTTLLNVKFNQLLNKESSSEISIPDSLWQATLPISRDDILDSILINNHQVQSLEKKLVAHEFEVALAEKKGNPSFMLGVDYIIIGKSDNPMIDPSIDGKDAIIFPKLSMSIPIYRSKYTSMVKKVNFEIQSTSDDIIAKRNLLTVLFEKGFNDYSNAQRRLNLNYKQEALARKSLNILTVEYTTNSKKFEELLRMERKLLGYQLARDKARTDLNAAVAFIEFLMGK